MPFIQVDTSQDYEDKPAPEGEYDLTVIRATAGESKSSGAPMITLFIRADDAPEGTAPFNHWILFPTGDDPEKDRMRNRDLVRICRLFSVDLPSDGFDTDDLAREFEGAKARAYVGQRASTDREGNETGEMQNTLRLPKAGPAVQEQSQGRRRARG